MKVAINFHPILFPRKKNDEQIKLLKLIKDISKNNLSIYFLKLGNTFIDLIDLALNIKESMEMIEKKYNSSVYYAFMSLVHCIRLSFFSLCVFLPFSSISLYNNFGFECRTTLLCYGYLSFHRKPEYLVYYFIASFLGFMTIGLIYNLVILVSFYMRKQTLGYISNKFPASMLAFTTASLKIKSMEDNIRLQNFAITKIISVDKHLVM